MARSDYAAWLDHQYGEVFDQLNLPEMQKSYLRTRWLDLVIWHDVAAARANRQYYRLRITTLVGGATATAFASLKLSGASGHWVSVLIFALTLTVTIAAGLEELLKYGERGRNYRQ